MKRWLSSMGALVAVVLLSGCSNFGGHAAPAPSPSAVVSTTATMEIGFYTSSGDAASGSTKLAYPTMHREAGGTGTYNDPITFAGDRDEFEPGTILYVPALRKYLIMEDDCPECDRSWEHGQRSQIKIWLEGAGKGAAQCADALRALVMPPNNTAQVNPTTNALPVDPGQLYDATGGSCHTSVSAVSSPTVDIAPALPTLPPTVQLPEGFYAETIAPVPLVRELVMLPDGDLLAGTASNLVMIVPNAESGNVGKPQPFLRLPDELAEGVAYQDGNIYIASLHHIWKVPYHPGVRVGSGPLIIANFRESSSQTRDAVGAPRNETSVLVTKRVLYFGVAASCDACKEWDRMRATVEQMPLLRGGTIGPKARRIPDPDALATNPDTGSVWVAGGGDLQLGSEHPYEFADNMTAHSGVVDYGWPECGENQRLFNPLHEPFQTCDGVAVPMIIFPAHTSNIGMTFYSSKQTGAYVFPAHYLGGLFLSSHGAPPSRIPQIAFVPMNGDQPVTPVNWESPTSQWETFMSDTHAASSGSDAQELFTGLIVGTEGSLFVGDDQRGLIYRIRP